MIDINDYKMNEYEEKIYKDVENEVSKYIEKLRNKGYGFPIIYRDGEVEEIFGYKKNIGYYICDCIRGNSYFFQFATKDKKEYIVRWLDDIIGTRRISV